MKMARVESAARAALQFVQALNRHDVQAMMQLLSDDCVLEASGPFPDGALISGKEAVTQFWQAFFQHLPSAHFDIEEIYGLGLRCIVRWRCHWEPDGTSENHVRGADILRVQNGLICEQQSYVKASIGSWKGV